MCPHRHDHPLLLIAIAYLLLTRPWSCAGDLQQARRNITAVVRAPVDITNANK